MQNAGRDLGQIDSLEAQRVQHARGLACAASDHQCVIPMAKMKRRNERERSLCADLLAIVALELAIGEQRSHQFGAGAVFSDRRNPAICILMKED